MNKVIIMRGIPGCGKTTYIKKNFPKAFICSADDYFTDEDGNYNYRKEEAGEAHAQSQTRFAAALEVGVPLVIVDNTNTRMWEMEHYIYLAEECGYKLEFIRFDVPTNDAHERNIHKVPLSEVERLADLFEELPEAYAKHEIIINDE